MALGLAATGLRAAPPDVLVLVNENEPVSRAVAEYYARHRSIPPSQIVRLRAPAAEEVGRQDFDTTIKAPLIRALARRKPLPKYLVLCHGLPLKIRGPGDKMNTEAASVDSELAALKLELVSGKKAPLPGSIPNPYFRAPRGAVPAIFLVTRLGGFQFADIKGLIDRATAAAGQPASRGRIVLDQHEAGVESDGNLWLFRAAKLFSPERVILEESKQVTTGVSGVIAYAAWGSNDRTRRVQMKGERDLKIRFLPGAIASEYVSTSGRTLREPPPQWRFGEWTDVTAYFEGSPQSLSGDLVRMGATGVSGHVYEPFLHQTPRPDILLPAYLNERATLGEAFWRSIPSVSWMNIVLGDPLCRLQ